MTEHFMTLENCHQHVGETFYSSWTTITQERINAFGEAINDPDPHHINPQWASVHSPWGKTIAFGWLTTSLTTSMLYEVFRYQLDGDPVSYGYPASYGFNRMRLIAPVLVDSRIRGKITLKNIESKGDNKTLYTFEKVVEIEGQEKPALVAEYLIMWLKDREA
ncbi:hypothetical protein HBA55_01640 [Pseudomaricurvus alkylphenolicus]|jgi:acyl dehydratase|uniref:MaoC/PaaZ C-terminal domain-containing protein n=1 Tax=Pseudomaricurvus alkylphenolicus TaxID=1306991 RepID=UPI0014238DE5|nr:MaoC/PaaZ C-terminal domain-containing protein [Pseudomaricurvus alkylphenolicus]NIB38265.1 hypothetical protein [Pseudomaricurvus alkylphenolicus]